MSPLSLGSYIDGSIGHVGANTPAMVPEIMRGTPATYTLTPTHGQGSSLGPHACTSPPTKEPEGSGVEISQKEQSHGLSSFQGLGPNTTAPLSVAWPLAVALLLRGMKGFLFKFSSPHTMGGISRGHSSHPMGSCIPRGWERSQPCGQSWGSAPPGTRAGLWGLCQTPKQRGTVKQEPKEGHLWLDLAEINLR